MPSEPVSVIVDRTVLPGNKEAFEHLLEGMTLACSEAEGYIDTHLTRPKSKDDHRYQVLFRFDSLENLEKWVQSERRLHWVEKINKIIENPTALQVITGLETWFSLPGQKTLTPPPRHKMAVVTWIAITPLLIVFNLFFGSLLDGLPLIPRFFLSTPWIVLIMTYFWMPYITKVFKFWLYPDDVEK